MIARLIAHSYVSWDVGLAMVPVVLSYAIVWVARSCAPRSIRYGVTSLLALVWLAFLPNTCYLLTEWRHFLYDVDYSNLFLQAQHDQIAFLRLCGLWLFYFCFSGAGMMAFTLSIRPIEHLAVKRGATTWFWAVPFFMALSLGVYLGLALRFNTWDLVLQPSAVWHVLMEIGARPKLIAFIGAFGLFLWFAYEVLDIWIDGLAERLSRITGKRVHLGPNVD